MVVAPQVASHSQWRFLLVQAMQAKCTVADSKVRVLPRWLICMLVMMFEGMSFICITLCTVFLTVIFLVLCSLRFPAALNDPSTNPSNHHKGTNPDPTLDNGCYQS